LGRCFRVGSQITFLAKKGSVALRKKLLAGIQFIALFDYYAFELIRSENFGRID
jgi:hypothetical protein